MVSRDGHWRANCFTGFIVLRQGCLTTVPAMVGEKTGWNSGVVTIKPES